jgi:Fic family protein
VIHPFPDGNGRTGRILNILYLVERGLLELPVLYLSKFVIERKGDYYALLRGITEADGADAQGAWEAWTLFMLEAVERTATATRDRIVAIRDLLDEALEDVRSRLPRVYSKELVELIFAQPYCRIRTLEAAGLAERQTASKYLRELEGIGWLSGAKVGREVMFVNRRFLELLSR